MSKSATAEAKYPDVIRATTPTGRIASSASADQKYYACEDRLNRMAARSTICSASHDPVTVKIAMAADST